MPFCLSVGAGICYQETRTRGSKKPKVPAKSSGIASERNYIHYNPTGLLYLMSFPFLFCSLCMDFNWWPLVLQEKLTSAQAKQKAFQNELVQLGDQVKRLEPEHGDCKKKLDECKKQRRHCQVSSCRFFPRKHLSWRLNSEVSHTSAWYMESWVANTVSCESLSIINAKIFDV